MRLQPWVPVLITLAAASALHAQQKIGISLGVGGAWIETPGSFGGRLVAKGAWGGTATLELSHASIPRFALITRLEYSPDQVAPAAPRKLSIGGGLRYALATSRHLSLTPSVEFEALRLTAVDAYNTALRPLVCRTIDVACPFDPSNVYGEGLLIEEGWRLGVSFRPAVQVWPVQWVGFELTPALRWLVPKSRSLPSSSHDRYTDPLYMTLGVGMVFKLAGSAP